MFAFACVCVFACACVCMHVLFVQGVVFSWNVTDFNCLYHLDCTPHLNTGLENVGIEEHYHILHAVPKEKKSRP